MRGSTLFQDLFTDVPVCVPKREGKGRSSRLIVLRNELLLHRYFFYGKYTQRRYEVIIFDLSNEFFLAERRVMDIIQESSGLLDVLRHDPPSVAQLRRMYPHWRWDV